MAHSILKITRNFIFQIIRVAVHPVLTTELVNYLVILSVIVLRISLGTSVRFFCPVSYLAKIILRLIYSLTEENNIRSPTGLFVILGRIIQENHHEKIRLNKIYITLTYTQNGSFTFLSKPNLVHSLCEIGVLLVNNIGEGPKSTRNRLIR